MITNRRPTRLNIYRARRRNREIAAVVLLVIALVCLAGAGLFFIGMAEPGLPLDSQKWRMLVASGFSILGIFATAIGLDLAR